MFGQKRQLVVGEVMQGGCQHEPQRASGGPIALDDLPGDGLHLLKIEQGFTPLEFDRQFLARPFEQPFHRLSGVRAFHVERSGARFLPRHLAIVAGVVATQGNHEDVESRSTHQVGLSAADLTKQRRQAASVGAGNGQVPGFQIRKEGGLGRQLVGHQTLNVLHLHQEPVACHRRDEGPIVIPRQTPEP